MIEIKQTFETEGEAVRALQHKEYFGVLWDFSQHMRQKLKHGVFDSDAEMNTLEELEETFEDYLNSAGIDLYNNQ